MPGPRVKSMDETVYDAAGGWPALLALARAWHERCLADPVVSHAFSHPGQHPQHTERLAAYWAQALGGPEELPAPHSQVLRLHSGNGDHADMDRCAIACFAQALVDADLPARVRPVLLDYFTWATGLMAAYPDSPDDVPDDLPLPRYSWEGPA